MNPPGTSAFRRNSGHLASVALVLMWSSGFVGAELGTRAGGTPLQLLEVFCQAGYLVLVFEGVSRGVDGGPTCSPWRECAASGRGQS